jgi:LysR family transcriptional regulator, nitrogen assimilation regulatory protein
MLDIRHLRYFVSVVDMGSLSKAAGALSISQPWLSRQVFATEYQLGVPPLLRSRACVRPTDAALKLNRHRPDLAPTGAGMAVYFVSERGSAIGQVAVGLPTQYRRGSGRATRRTAGAGSSRHSFAIVRKLERLSG